MTKLAKKRYCYRKTGGICIICGKDIGNDPRFWSLEHYIPCAVYKWIPNPEVEALLESGTNLFVVHKHCNFHKNAKLPNHHEIRKIHANQEIKKELYHLYTQVKSSIEQYQALKYSVWREQNRHCAFCNKMVKFATATLRRKNNDFERTKDNAMCLCFKCSIRSGSHQYKHAMAKKKNII